MNWPPPRGESRETPGVVAPGFGVLLSASVCRRSAVALGMVCVSLSPPARAAPLRPVWRVVGGFRPPTLHVPVG